MELQPIEIQSKIYEIRGRRVMLDFDLADMYNVPTKALKQAVRRNIERFPDDFMFELTQKEFRELVTDCDHMMKHSYIASLAFTQEGAAMLSGVLRSPVAIEANIRIMRAFSAMREYLLSYASLTAEMAQLRERMLLIERATDENIGAINDLSEDMGKELDTIYEAITALSIKLPQLNKPRAKIGFKQSD